MTTPSTRSRRRLRWLACRAIAWVLCAGGLVSATSVAFRGVEAHARFALADWRARKRGGDGELLAIVRDRRPPLPLAADSAVKQPLWVSHDGLCGVRIEADPSADDSVGRAGPVGWRLVAVELDDTVPKLIASGTLDGPADDGWYDIAFAPIADSAGGRYLLKLFGPDAASARPAPLAVYTTPEARPVAFTSGRSAEGDPVSLPEGTTLHVFLRHAAPPDEARR